MLKIEKQMLVWMAQHVLMYHGYIPGYSRFKKSISTRVHLLHGVAEHASTLFIHKEASSYEVIKTIGTIMPAYFM